MLLFIQAPFQIMVTVHMALCMWNDGTLTKRAKLQDTFRVDLEKYVSLWYSLVSIHLSIMYNGSYHPVWEGWGQSGDLAPLQSKCTLIPWVLKHLFCLKHDIIRCLHQHHWAVLSSFTHLFGLSDKVQIDLSVKSGTISFSSEEVNLSFNQLSNACKHSYHDSCMPVHSK